MGNRGPIWLNKLCGADIGDPITGYTSCKRRQFKTHSGHTCKDGHGGADGIIMSQDGIAKWDKRYLDGEQDDDPDFEEPAGLRAELLEDRAAATRARLEAKERWVAERLPSGTWTVARGAMVNDPETVIFTRGVHAGGGTAEQMAKNFAAVKNKEALPFPGIPESIGDACPETHGAHNFQHVDQEDDSSDLFCVDCDTKIKAEPEDKEDLPHFGPDDLKVGDVVVLTAGGPRMTVVQASASKTDHVVECIWFTRDGKLKRHPFNIATLRPPLLE